MKKWICALCGVVVSLSLYAAEPYTITKIIRADSTLTKGELYVAVNDWFATTYKNSQKVIQMADKDAGIIIGKAVTETGKLTFSMQCSVGWLNYTIKVQCRDGRVRAEVSNVIHEAKDPKAMSSCSYGLITTAEVYKESGMGKNAYNEVWDMFKERISSYSEGLFASLEASVKQAKPQVSTNEDW